MWYFKEGFQMFGCSPAYKTWSFTKFFYFKVNVSIQVCFFSVEKLPAETMNQIFLQINQFTTATNYIWWFVGFSKSKRWIIRNLLHMIQHINTCQNHSSWVCNVSTCHSSVCMASSLSEDIWGKSKEEQKLIPYFLP